MYYTPICLSDVSRRDVALTFRQLANDYAKAKAKSFAVKYGETIDFAFATILFATIVPALFEKAAGGFHRARTSEQSPV